MDTLAPLVGLVDPAHPAAAAAPPLPAALRARVAVTSRLPLHELVRSIVRLNSGCCGGVWCGLVGVGLGCLSVG